MKLVDRLPIRLVLAALLGFKAFDAFLPTALAIAHRMRAAGVAERLARQTPGDDYARLVPLLEAIPPWLHGLTVLAGGLYLLAIVGVVRPTRRAHLPVLAGLGVEALARFAARPIIAVTGVVVNPHPSAVATVVIPYVLPFLVALALWQIGREASAPVAERSVEPS